MTRNDAGAVSQGHEDMLSDVFGKVRVAADAAKRGGINGVDITTDEFGKRRFVARSGESSKQDDVGGHKCLMATAETKTEQRIYSDVTNRESPKGVRTGRKGRVKFKKLSWQPRMHTDMNRIAFPSPFESVFICVHPWFNGMSPTDPNFPLRYRD